MNANATPELSHHAASEVGKTCACFNLRQATRRVTQLFDDVLRPVELRATQFTLLNAVRVMGPVPISQLAERLGMDRTTLTRSLQRLQRRDLVHIESGHDRRVHDVSLTREGAQLLARAYPHWQEAQKRVTDAMGGESFERLLSDLRQTAEVPLNQ